MGRKVFHKQVKENFSNVSLYLLAERWVKSHYVSHFRFPLMGVGWAVVLQFTRLSASLHSLFTLQDISDEFLTRTIKGD